MRHSFILKNAALLSLFFLLVTLLQWSLGDAYLRDKVLNTSLWALTTITAVGFGVFNLQRVKKQMGFILLKDAFALSFLPIFIALIANGIFKLVLFNYIDPTYIELSRKFTVENTLKLKEKVVKTLGEKPFDELFQQAKTFNPYTLRAIGISITFSIFGYLFPTLILAALLKKNPSIDEV